MRRAVGVAGCVLFVIALLSLSSGAVAAERVVHVKVRADSEQPGDEAFRAMDGNAGSIWHSGWKAPAAVTDLPHEIVVDLGEPREITGFTYLPRAHAAGKSAIKDYEVYLSDRPEAKK
ncbi:MAG: discoidin domain-containing protein, partial [Planctomycetota bacterium]